MEPHRVLAGLPTSLRLSLDCRYLNAASLDYVQLSPDGKYQPLDPLRERSTPHYVPANQQSCDYKYQGPDTGRKRDL